MGRELRLSYAALVVAMFLWASLHPAAKLVLPEISPAQLTLVRAVLAALTLSGLVALRGDLGELVGEVLDRPWTAIGLGLINFVISSIVSLAALQYLPASMTNLLVNTSPIWLAVAAVATGRAREVGRLFAGVGLAFFGVALVLLRDATPTTLFAAGLPDLRGVALALLSSVLIAVATAWGRAVMQGRDPLVLTAVMAGCAVPPSLLLTIPDGGVAGILTVEAATLPWLLWVGVACTAVNFALWLYALKVVTAAKAAAFQYLIPLFGVILAYLFLAEPITPPLAVGGLCIVGGLVMAQSSRRPAVESVAAPD